MIFLLALFEAVLLNLFMAGISSGGHSSGLLGKLFELNIFTFGLPIVIPTTILYFAGKLYEKNRKAAEKEIDWGTLALIQLGILCVPILGILVLGEF